MYEYFRGDYYRATQMIWGALSSTYLPDVFRIPYEELLAELKARKAAGEAGHNQADSVKDIAVAKIKAVDYVLKKHAKEGEEQVTVDEVVSLQDLVEKSRKLRDATTRAKKRLFDDLMKVCAADGMEVIAAESSISVRTRPQHARTTSV